MVNFYINYTTHYGDKLGLLLGDDAQKNQLIFMQSINGSDWTYEMTVDKKTIDLHYKYVVIRNDGSYMQEWGSNRTVTVTKDADLSIIDKWRPRNLITNTFLSSAFTKAIFRRKANIKSKKQGASAHQLTFKLTSAIISADNIYGIIGGSKALGEWKKAIPMQCETMPTWQATIPYDINNVTVNYKYVILDAKTLEIKSWEIGENRSASLPSQQSAMITDDYFRGETMWRGAGVAIPVFSLRSATSFGIGELTDLAPLVTWTHKAGMNMIQVLPINDTLANMTWADSYPYAAISVMALHPLYINIPSICPFADAKQTKAYERDLKDLNELEQIDYDKVLERKFHYLRILFDQEKGKLDKDASFLSYIKDQSSWLTSYAAFCYLRDKNKSCVFTSWPEYSTYNATQIEQLSTPKSPAYFEILFYKWLQYHADKQLLDMRDMAREHNISLKGDLPIGIYRHSCDAWIAPELYNMTQQAGAPPDDYAVMGQNWGFPTYNWDIMRKDGYQWWRSRMQQLNRYFDALRIDHILGFFRIWQIPTAEVQGTLGMFNPRLPFDRDELARYGLHGDLRRFTDPYITDDLLHQSFGTMAEWVKTTFLQSSNDNQYTMQPSFKHQQDVVRFFEENPTNKHLEEAIITMIGNVILLPEVDGHHFNPRITVNTTTSFQYLPSWQQQIVMNLYNDYYFRRHDQYWKEQALERLPGVLDASDMMICGEDLGMIPDAVPGVMKDLNIVSLEIQRMPKGSAKFGQVATYPYESVCSPSCHDMSTIRGWWEGDHELAKSYYYEYMHRGGITPMNCDSDIVRSIVWDHLSSPSMLAIFPIQDLVGMDDQLRKPDAASEQINIPANPKHYWRYRFHLNMEDLLEADVFTNGVRQMVVESGRK